MPRLQAGPHKARKRVSKESPVAWGRMVFASRDLETIRVYYQNLFLKQRYGTPARAISPQLKLNFERDDVLPPQPESGLRRFRHSWTAVCRTCRRIMFAVLYNADILIVDAHRRRIVDIVHNFWSP
jgi:hypothetical protein